MTRDCRVGVVSGISTSESPDLAGFNQVVGAFGNRRLDHTEFRWEYLDATSLHVDKKMS